MNFVIQPRKNKPNVWLLSGLLQLDLLTSAISTRDNIDPFPGEDSNWKITRTSLRLFANAFQKMRNRPLVTIADTSPSFTPFTQIAICSSDKLIIPYNLDILSQTGIMNVFRLLHDEDTVLGPNEFVTKCRKEEIQLPKVHLLIANSFATYGRNTDRCKPIVLQEDSRFTSMAYVDQEWISIVNQKVYEKYVKHPEFFTIPNLKNDKAFLNQQQEIFCDMATVASVSSFLAQPVCSLRPGNARIQHHIVQINEPTLEKAKMALKGIVKKM